MKKFFSLVLLVSGFNFGFHLAQAWADPAAPISAVPVITPPTGFDEGTDTRLTSSQIEDLLPWASNSQMQLKDLLEMVRPLQAIEAKKALIQGIESIVSASAPKRTETLMRYVLNRALKINQELEKEMASQDAAAINVELRVLKLSAQLAVKYYESDIEYLKSRQVQETRSGVASPGEVTLPLTKFGQEYAAFLMAIDQSILDASAQYNIAMMAMGLLQWDLYRDGKERTRCAPAIAKINNFLRVMPEKATDGDSNAVMRLRQIRQLYQKVNSLMGESMGAIVSPIASLPAQVIRRDFPEEECDPEKTAKAKSGSVCHVGSNRWEVSTEGGQSIYTDLTSGMKVTGIVAVRNTFNDAQSSCPSGYHVPTKDNFVVLNKRSIRSVVPDMKNHLFWSSSVYPYDSDYAYVFNGGNGGIYYVNREYYNYAVVCVAGR